MSFSHHLIEGPTDDDPGKMSPHLGGAAGISDDIHIGRDIGGKIGSRGRGRDHPSTDTPRCGR